MTPKILLYTLFSLINTIKVDFKLFDCGPRDTNQTLIKQSFDIYKGFSEIVVKKSTIQSDTSSIEIDDIHFDDTCIQRFKVNNWNKTSFIFSSDYYVGKNVIKSRNVKTLVDLYYKISLLMNQDSIFRNELLEDCTKERAASYFREVADERCFKVLINALEKTNSYEGEIFEEYFDIFKDILITSLEIISGSSSLKLLYGTIRDLSINEIYSYDDELFFRLDFLNRILSQSRMLSESRKCDYKRFVRPRQYISN